MNTTLFSFLHQFAHQSLALDTFFIFVAERLGWVMVAATFLLPFLIRKQREKYAWFMIGLALAVAAFARLGPVELIRALYPVERPFVVLNEVAPLAEVISWQAPLISHEPTRSFPSGHAALYFALAATLFFWNKKIGSVYYAAALLITVSRVIAGIHWPADIAAGAVVGMSTALALYWVARRLFRSFRPLSLFE